MISIARITTNRSVRAQAARIRGKATMAGGQHPQQRKNWKDAWLSDKGAYPVMIIIAGAVGLAVVWGGHTIITNPDVRVSKDRRREILRDGGGVSVEEH